MSIKYKSSENDTTSYWIAINDIDIDQKMFFVDAFNVSKINNETGGVINVRIYFDKILSATMIDMTTYPQPGELIPKIESNLERLSWLEYDFYNDTILDYIRESMKYEEVAYQKETALVSGIDQEQLDNLSINNVYELSIQQIGELVPKLERLSNQDHKRKFETVDLILNLLSIHTDKGLFVVAYKELKFNPVKRALTVSDEIIFNYDFASDETKAFKHNLKNYLDIETDDFTELFIHDQKQAKDLLMEEVKRYNESIDDRPYIMDLRRSYYAHIDREIESIKMHKKEHQLSVPLQAFFGNMTKQMIKRKKEVHVVAIDDKVNIDQLRVIYNALVQPITYVQGPPGTGKTQTIINVVISSFFNGQKILISSNNNKPINDIYDKLMSLKGRYQNIPLPIIRLGNEVEVNKSLDNIQDILKRYQHYESDDEKLELHKENKKNNIKRMNKMLETYETRNDLIEEIDALETFKKRITSTDFRSEILISTKLDNLKRQVDSLPKVSEHEIQSVIEKVDNRLLTWLFFTSIKHIKRILEPKNEELKNIIYLEDSKERVKAFNEYTSKDKNFENLQRIFPIILTTNQSAYRLGSQFPKFDLVVIDEAGQCATGPSLFAVSRGHRLLLVGDQNQLKPVISLPPETNKILMDKYQVPSAYNYIENPILLTFQKNDTISKFVLLRYHYRSDPQIIGFSNKKYYKNQLIFNKEKNLQSNALDYINIDTSQTLKSSIRNVSEHEVQAIVQDIQQKGYKNVGIITPFRNQADYLKITLEDSGLSHVDSGTIHTFQGDEKDVVYLSTAITKHSGDKTFEWVKNNQELLNVATTRAKNKLVLVGDLSEIKKRSSINNDLNELVDYIKHNGKEVNLTESNQTSFINGANFKNYNTKKEAEFFDTINHILTLNTKYKLENKVRVASILDRFTTPKQFDYGLKAEFDLVVFKIINKTQVPILVIELDGDEHSSNKDVIKRDKLKEQICKENNIDIIRIGNDYSRRYSFIKEILFDILR